MRPGDAGIDERGGIRHGLIPSTQITFFPGRMDKVLDADAPRTGTAAFLSDHRRRLAMNLFGIGPGNGHILDRRLSVPARPLSGPVRKGFIRGRQIAIPATNITISHLVGFPRGRGKGQLRLHERGQRGQDDHGHNQEASSSIGDRIHDGLLLL